MRFARFRRVVIAVAVVMAIAPVSRAQGVRLPAVQGVGHDRVPGRFLVRFEAGTSAAQRNTLHSRIGAHVVRRIEMLGVDVVDVPRGVDAVGRYTGAPGVMYAEPDYVAHLAFEPNDPCIHTPCVPGSPGTQWQLSYTNAVYGWQAYPGRIYSSTERLGIPTKIVKVAVIDTKIDTAHQDWINTGGTSTDAAKGGQLDLSDAKDLITDPRQQAGGAAYHGTFVAGILGAAAGNAYGIAGLGYMSQIMPITAVDGNGRASADFVASGILHAWQRGARVINLSLGLTEDSQTVHDAIKAVTAGANPSLVVAAAGNCGTDPDLCDEPFYPGSYPEVMSVSGTDATDRRAYCSNYNANVSVSAPADGVVSLKSGGGMMKGTCGTSAAAPQVSGLAALLLSQDPARKPYEVRAIIESTADDKGIAGRDPSFGFGRINVERALRFGQSLPLTTAVYTTIPPGSGGTSTVTALAASAKPIVKAELYVDHPGCDGVTPGTPMQIAEAGGGYKRLVATVQVPASTLAGAHPVWIHAYDGTSWGPFTVGALFVDRGRPVVGEVGASDLVVRALSGAGSAVIAYSVADDFSSVFTAAVQVTPNVSTAKNPPAVYKQTSTGIRLGLNQFTWTPDSSVPPGSYRIAIGVADEAGNPGGVIFKKTITVV